MIADQRIEFRGGCPRAALTDPSRAVGSRGAVRVVTNPGVSGLIISIHACSVVVHLLISYSLKFEIFVSKRGHRERTGNPDWMVTTAWRFSPRGGVVMCERHESQLTIELTDFSHW